MRVRTGNRHDVARVHFKQFVFVCIVTFCQSRLRDETLENLF